MVCFAVVASIVLSPDLAFAAFPGRDGLLVAQLPGGRGLQLVTPTGKLVRVVCGQVAACGTPRTPRWSPDGQELVFSHGYAGQIEVLNVTGACVVCRTGTPVGSTGPSFVPSGGVVTYTDAGGASRGRLAEVAIAPGASWRLPAARLGEVVWSSRGSLAGVHAGVVLVGRPGHRLRAVGRGSWPSWAPDGRQLVVARAGWIWMVDVRRRHERRIVRGRDPAFSPSGRSIAYVAHGDQLRVLSLRTGRSRSIGHVDAVSVDWEPLVNYGACRPPAGAIIKQTTHEVVVYETPTTSARGSFSSSVLYGCLRSSGRITRIGSTYVGSENESSASVVAVAGTDVAVESGSSGKYDPGVMIGMSVVDLATGRMRSAVLCPGVSSCQPPDAIVLSTSGALAWHQDQGAPDATFTGLACPSSSLCLATDNLGRVLTSQQPTGPSSAWTTIDLDAVPINAIACPTASLCVAVDQTGNALSTTNPTAGTGAWSSEAIDPGTVLTAVSCTTDAVCAAVDDQGRILTTSTPAGAWATAQPDPGHKLAGVSCPTDGLCVAADDAGRVLTSTNPADPHPAWTLATVTGNPASNGFVQFTAVACPTVSLCAVAGEQFNSPGSTPLAGGRLSVSTNPTGGTPAWTTTPVPTPLTRPEAIACPSATSCSIIDAVANIYTTTDATDPQPTWTTTATLIGSSGSGLACPGPNLCLSTAGSSTASSANPTDPHPTWTAQTIDAPPCGPDGCLYETIQALTANGVETVDRTKIGGDGHHLTDLTLTGTELTWTDNGNPATTIIPALN